MKLRTFLLMILVLVGAFALIPGVSAAETTEDSAYATLYDGAETELTDEQLAIIGVLAIIFIIIFVPIAIAMYIYSSFAYMALAKKLKMKQPWLAWIPIVRYYLISQMAGMPWWPIFLLLGYLLLYPLVRIASMISLKLTFSISSIRVASMIAFTVFYIIWSWKIFERVSRPGWWSLFRIIPFAGDFVFLVFLGIAAWSKKSKVTTPPRKTKRKPAKKTVKRKRK